VAGITFLMLGIIGSYVGKLIMTANNTPLFVVRDTVNLEDFKHEPSKHEEKEEKSNIKS
jgi:hypothetical protein